MLCFFAMGFVDLVGIEEALPDEVLEVHISEEEYVHFEVIGHASEAEVIRAKSNLKRFGQEINCRAIRPA